MKKLLSLALAFLIASPSFADALITAHTAFPNPDQQAEWGLFYSVENLNTDVQNDLLSTYVVNNNASQTVTVPAGTAYVIMAGTNIASAVTVNLSSAANTLDNQQVTIMTQSGVASGVTVASSGATIRGATATWSSAGAYETLRYVKSLLTWFVVGY